MAWNYSLYYFKVSLIFVPVKCFTKPELRSSILFPSVLIHIFRINPSLLFTSRVVGTSSLKCPLRFTPLFFVYCVISFSQFSFLDHLTSRFRLLSGFLVTMSQHSDARQTWVCRCCSSLTFSDADGFDPGIHFQVFGCRQISGDRHYLYVTISILVGLGTRHNLSKMSNFFRPKTIGK